MARHRRHHRRHHRRNPFGLDGNVFKEAAFVAGGAVGAAALPSMVAPSFSTGWGGVLASGVVAVGLGMAGKIVGDHGGDMLKGGLAITVLKALKQAGINTPGLGLYAPSWFGVPTSSSQYLQASAANMGPYNRGQGTIFFPGPGGTVVAAPAAAAAGPKSHLGYHRFRSRYAGSYG